MSLYWCSWGEGLGSGSGGWWGGAFSVEKDGKMVRVWEGGGWGGDRQRNRQVHCLRVCRNYLLANYPSVLPRIAMTKALIARSGVH